MGFTVGITGHTNGFGKFITARCRELGYNVEGFSRTNGYDLLKDIDIIFNKKFHVIVNNAEIGNAQINICLLANKNKIPCINIGSKITEAKVSKEELIIKKQNKTTLRDLSNTLNQKYLTWGFLENHELIKDNPDLLENTTLDQAVQEVIDELAPLQYNV
tara:strand:+ start:83 stop:562 length:480 start_codon:yes stop_codon:yes gene_type:complete